MIGPLAGPHAAAINQRVVMEGGLPLRHRMLEGRAQFWVVRGDGSTLAGANLAEIAAALEVVLPMKSDALIPIKKAVAITGYSQTTLGRHFHEGSIKGEFKHPASKRGLLFDRESLDQWAATMKEKGGIHLPRVRRKGQRPRQNNVVRAGSNGRPIKIGGGDAHSRLMAMVERYKGTPLEFTASEFTEKAITVALDRLEGKH